MDEEKYLKTKVKIERYRMVAHISIIAGTVLPVIGLMYVSLNPGLAGSFGPFKFLLLIGSTLALIIFGVWTKWKAKVLEIILEAYDKKRERIWAQHAIHPVTAERIVQLPCCPSCDNPVLLYWKVCGHCGKRLKKSD